MPRRGKRRRIAKRCYEDDTGRSITYDDPRNGKQREIRFPPQTPIVDMRKEAARRIALVSGSGRADTYRGSLAAAVDEWEPLEQTLSSWRERRAELRAWCRAEVNGKLLGDMRLTAIDSKIARAVMSQWTAAGVAPKTIRNRRWSLQRLYHVLQGDKSATPVDDIAPPAKTKTIPIAIEPAHVLDVLAKLIERERAGILRDAKTRARFMLRAVTGKRPSEIMRAEPGDVDLERREWRVRDGKGGWSEGLYLNDEMIAAWELFIQADAWGAFETSAMAKTLRAAGWTETARPYELRHSAGIALSDAGVDLSDISGFLGHKDLRTTRQTYVPIRQARMQRASEALAGRFNGWNVPAPEPPQTAAQGRRPPQNLTPRRRNVPSAVPYSHVEKRGSLRKSEGSQKRAAQRGKQRKSQGK